MSVKNIFISYRRDDSKAIAGRIHEHLARAFGEEAIFFDINKDSIPLGLDFGEFIKKAIDQVMAMLVIIGDKWRTVTDKEGKPRLHDPDDLVRLEVEAGLARGKSFPVILLFIEGTPLDVGLLPDSLKPLGRRNGIPVRSGREFEHDIGLLIDGLEKIGIPRLAQGKADPQTGNQVNIKDVKTGGGDFVVGDKNVTAGDRGIAVGGSVSGSTFVTGDGNKEDTKE